jgi:HSP20 family protein
MKNILAGFLFIALAVSSAAAEQYPTDQDYKNLDEVRGKLVRMKREMDKFVKEIASTYPAQGAGASGVFGQDVKVDMSQTDKDIIVKADLPGMDKDKIDIVLENSKLLKISGSREITKKTESPGIVTQERMSGRFERVLELPAECKNEGISAAYKNGVLDIVIPKKAAAKPEEVKIKIQ